MNNKKPYYRWQGTDLFLELYVQTRASKNTVAGQHGERLKVTITAPAVEGKANKYLIKFLAQYFDVPQKQVEITKGNNSRYKSILISDPKTHLVEFGCV
ncbi:MAG: hypothetical protein ACD_21C00256G0007 [uncultured bacterium]|nr:MAG: hypothetical protein ACD_21C00256G0007 [uncultured bacterium]